MENKTKVLAAAGLIGALAAGGAIVATTKSTTDAAIDGGYVSKPEPKGANRLAEARGRIADLRQQIQERGLPMPNDPVVEDSDPQVVREGAEWVKLKRQMGQLDQVLREGMRKGK